MKKTRRWFLVISITLILLPAGWLAYSRSSARLDLSDSDDSYTAGKSIGLVPASGEIYAEGVGFVDSTIYYQATVTPDEVSWLDRVPSVERLEPPSSSPAWWRLALWWHARSTDMRYYRTVEKWPCIYAYSRQHGVVFGTVEFD